MEFTLPDSKNESRGLIILELFTFCPLGTQYFNNELFIVGHIEEDMCLNKNNKPL